MLFGGFLVYPIYVPGRSGFSVGLFDGRCGAGGAGAIACGGSGAVGTAEVDTRAGFLGGGLFADGPGPPGAGPVPGYP